MTPSVALSRHVEWLEYALAAARAEQGSRRARLEKASKKNRSKRESRLAEVSAEIDELAALLVGLRELQRLAATPTAARASGTKRARPRSGTASRATRRTTGSGAG